MNKDFRAVPNVDCATLLKQASCEMTNTREIQKSYKQVRLLVYTPEVILGCERSIKRERPGGVGYRARETQTVERTSKKSF